MARKHHETHRSQHVGWLRAAVLGANDGLISTASLVVGMAAANADGKTLLLCAAPDFYEHNRAQADEAVLYTARVDVPHAGLP